MVFQGFQGSGEKQWLNTAHSVCMANQAAVEKRPRLGKEEKEEEERWKWQRQGQLYGKHDSQEWPNNFILEAWNSKSRGDQNGKKDECCVQTVLIL